ncbi:MAG TPA: glycosyltransferase family 4 protein [Chromatiaceae bacterium]|nr:glycosyltransferase family 4 protein [Chromatiaceae bacterium]
MSSRKKAGPLMITQLFLPTKGGTAMSFDDDFRRIGQKEVHIVTEAVPGGKEYDETHPNTVHRLDLKRRPWLRPESLFIYLKLLFASLWITATRPINAIFAGRALPEGLVALIVGRLTRRPVLIYAHGEELTGWGRGRKFRAMCYALGHADWVLSNSDNTRDTLIDLIGVKPEHVAVVYPTVDAERFHPGPPQSDLRESIGWRPGQYLILSIGRLMERKGFDQMIRALPRLHERGMDVHYAIIGIGEDLPRLQALVQSEAVGDRVHFLGHVSYEDLPRWYITCDLFAMPNRDVGGDSEGFGLVFLEAAASGKPVIAGIAGGTASAVVDGVTGLRVDGEKLEEIVAAAEALLSDPERAEAMGRVGRQRVLENFVHERRVAELKQLAGLDQ